MDEDCFEEHGYEADFGPWVGKDAAEIGHHRRTIEWRRRRRRNAAEGEERHDGHDQSERAENCEHAAPAEHVSDHARDRGADEVAGKGYGKQPADRHLALIDRDKIAGESHRHGKYPACHHPRRDPHGQEQREAHRHGTDQRRQRDDQQAEIHQPGLAEEVAGDAQRGLHQRIREGEGARQQRGRVHLDREIIRDQGDHGIDCAREQGLRKNHEADDFKTGGMAELA